MKYLDTALRYKFIPRATINNRRVTITTTNIYLPVAESRNMQFLVFENNNNLENRMTVFDSKNSDALRTA